MKIRFNILNIKALNHSASIFLLGMALCGFSGCGKHAEAHQEEEEGHNHEGATVIEPDKARQFGIETEALLPGSFSEVVKVSGQIEPASTDRVAVTARCSGIFTLSAEITAGMDVSAGTVIGTISSNGVQGGDANAAAKATADAAKKELERLTPLYKDGLVTASTYNEAERAYKEAAAIAGTVSPGSAAETTPAAGVITDIFVTSGQYVEVGTPVATVAKNARLTLRADVPEKYMAFIPSVVSANFRPDYSESIISLDDLNGRIITTQGSANARNGYIPVYFTFSGNGNTIPGAFAEIYLKGVARDGVASVPREALIEMQGNKYVYVCEDGHAYEKRLVKTGASDGSRVEIKDGVKENEQVVVKGAAVVRMAETSAIAPPAHTHNH